MRKASTVLLEQGTQTPSPAPDLIPAERLTENLHWDWYRKRGHFTAFCCGVCSTKEFCWIPAIHSRNHFANSLFSSAGVIDSGFLEN